ncbi:MAG TPA: transglutaminase family protein [Candidatus Dormibacteraeota bacterium]|nr:transglutaminase family protein [Candidatus Dormibacteraeota bacterium]
MQERLPRIDASIVALDSSQIKSLGLLNHTEIDWGRVQRSVYLIHQNFHYEYPGPIADLNHHLVVLPPKRHGDQRRLRHQLDVSVSPMTVAKRRDVFGNVVLDLHVPFVETAIDFEAWIVVERFALGPLRMPGTALTDRRYLDPSPLTQPDEALRAVATSLRMAGEDALPLARRINRWVYETMSYAAGVTSVETTAAQALALSQGVCQDYAHIMLALCRLCELPARYVSGHLLGEGGTHAWVDVLVPAAPTLPSPGGGGKNAPEAVAVAFDPTHGREVGLSYVTVAVGRDYRDVAPTSGSYKASHKGQLSSQRRVGLTAVQYARERRSVPHAHVETA